MTIDETNLAKGQARKLNVLRKSIDNKLAEDPFSKWLKVQSKAAPIDTPQRCRGEIIRSSKNSRERHIHQAWKLELRYPARQGTFGKGIYGNENREILGS